MTDEATAWARYKPRGGRRDDEPEDARPFFMVPPDVWRLLYDPQRPRVKNIRERFDVAEFIVGHSPSVASSLKRLRDLQRQPDAAKELAAFEASEEGRYVQGVVFAVYDSLDVDRYKSSKASGRRERSTGIVEGFLQVEGSGPGATVAELEKATGWSSKWVRDHLGELEAKGKVRKERRGVGGQAPYAYWLSSEGAGDEPE